MMFHFPSSVARPIAITICLATGLAGCGIFPERRPGKPTPDDAYIDYWGAPAGGTKLRLAVKDLIDMKGVVTTAGSDYICKHNIPAPRDAKCLAGARREGVTIVGKTNLSELAVAPSGLNRYYGTPRNPLNRKVRLIPGGSSSGSAVAVADGTADVAFGTDTCGSIRVPAACCGVVGLKTTFGLVPLKGVFPIAPQHLDTVGPLGKNIAMTVKGMELLEPGFAEMYREAMAAKPTARSIRIGRVYIDETHPEIDQAIDAALAKAGFTVVRLDQKFEKAWDQAENDGTNVAAGGAWLNDHFWTLKPGISTRTKAVIALGKITYDTSYDASVKRIAAWQRTLREVLRHVDLVALPTLNGLPPRVPPFQGSPLFETRMLRLENTVAANYAGNPALAVPVPITDKVVPLTSVELVGRPFGEAALLNAGRFIEAARLGTATGG